MPDRKARPFRPLAQVLGADDYRRLYEHASICIFRSTPDGRYVNANPAAVKLHGYDSEEELLSAVGNVPEEVYVDPIDRTVMQELMDVHGAVDGYECEIYRHKSRERRWVRQHIYSVCDSDGVVQFLEGYVEDITQWKKAEQDLEDAREHLERKVVERTEQLEAVNRALKNKIEELNRSEEETRTRDAWIKSILENSPIEIVIKDTEGRILAISTNVAEQQNVPVESFFGTTTADYLPADIADIYMSADRRVVETGEPYQNEVKEELDGRTHFFLSQKFPMRDGDGLINGICSLTTDMTEIREAEARLVQAQKMEAVGQLTGGVAHDFNNLLAVIMGNAELLAERLGRDKLVDAIIRASTRGSELTQRLLAFSRRQPLQPQALNVADLVQGMISLLSRTLGKTIELDTCFPPSTWPAWADPGQVEDALLNLAVNARDAMSDGGRLRISGGNEHLDDAYVSRHPEMVAGDYVVISVQDDGAGMSPDTAAQAFEPFFTTKSVGQGSGLGLSMVYGFAKQSGGHVSIDSEAGRGTTVKLYLPRPEHAGNSIPATTSDDPPHGMGETILLVEDNPDVRELAVDMLRGLNYRAIEAEDAAQAREMIGRHRDIALVMSGVVLPGGTSGLAFAEQMKSSNPALPFVFMSGYLAESSQPSGTVAPGRVLLNKPFQREQLAETLRTVLGED